MRNLFSAAIGLTLLATACSGSSGSDTTGTSGGISTSGANSTGGTSTGRAAGTSGTTGGLLANGSPCTSNATCKSDICGAAGTGHCCSIACSTTDADCKATDCDDTGVCAYPGSSSACGTPSCSGTMITPAGTCNSAGSCIAGSQGPCPNNFACHSATACTTVCTVSSECISGFFCVADAGACDSQIKAGACTVDAACVSGVCGINGTGHCCTTACTNTTAPCGTTDCDDTSGACTFPIAGTACGSTLESCTGNTQQNPSTCDGNGTCNDTPGTTDCTPYICGATACLLTCKDNTSCEATDFCDVFNSTCCTGLTSGGAVAVDSKTGNDAAACCGIAGNAPCQTLHQAMRLIDDAQAQNVTITATVAGAGGDWAPAQELYPIVLGWGADLKAPGVFFTEGGKGHHEIFDIKAFSGNDNLGYASIVGTAASQVSIGMDVAGDQSTDNSSIQVEASSALYIANASVNGSATNLTTAITVAAGGTLWLAEDKSGAVTGTVNIGNDDSKGPSDGYNGIVCLSGNGLGCTITDATLKGGVSSVVIQGQEGIDIDAEDNAVITLTSAPVIGLAPKTPGFGTCPIKTDSSTANTEAILLNGSATMTFSNGAVQCISGNGFTLQAADGLTSTPTLTLSGSTIQNTEYAILATAGSATVTSSTIQYNYNGIQQGTDNTNSATVDLSGGGVGTNTVVCSNSVESIFGTGGLNGLVGVSVLNNTTSTLKADNVNWDTNDATSPPPDEPDLFSCNATLSTCTCQNTDTTCATAVDAEGMDAVYTSTGSITQTGAGLSGADCTVQSGGQACGKGKPCPPGNCCNGLTFKCQMGQICPG